MNQHPIPALVRTLTRIPSRRDVLYGLVGAAVGLIGQQAPSTGRARKRKRKHKRAPVMLNQYQCVDVGNPCRGDDTLCCSGICEGTKPRKGKPDRSRCVAHDADVCQSGQLSIPCGGSDETTVLCTLPNGEPGLCERTTGNASYCAGSYIVCESCAKDADCHALCGPGAACITCTVCAGGTACVGLDLESCPD